MTLAEGFRGLAELAGFSHRVGSAFTDHLGLRFCMLGAVPGLRKSSSDFA
jgi:hypothetical protein